jgi:uncharacterized protein
MMAMVRNYEVVSADSHLEVPPDMWSERLPDEYRARAPHVVELEDGGHGWAMGEGEPVPLGLQVTGGQKYPDFVDRGRSFDEGLPGTGGPEQRVSEQEQDGVDAEVLFSSVVATGLKRVGDDRDLAVAISRTYNEWANEYAAHDPERLWTIGIVPFTGIDDACESLDHISGLEHVRGAMLLQFPSGKPYLTPEDDAFWTKAEQLGLPVIAHHNFGGGEKAQHPLPGMRREGKTLDIHGTSEGADLGMFVWLLTTDLPIPTLPIVTLLQLMVSGTLDRFPGLRFHFAETGIGWLPYWLEQMEDRYDRHRFWAKINLPRRPTQYINDHFTLSFQEDHAGIALRHMIGVDNICWASDFPHSVSDWPYSREALARMMEGVPDDERRKIQALNIAAQLKVVPEDKKDELAKKALTPDPKDVPARGERRIA